MIKKYSIFACFFFVITSLAAQDILNPVRHGELQKVKQLLEKDASLVHVTDEWGNGLLALAILNSDFDMIKLLVDKGADVNAARKDNDSTPMHRAAQMGSMEIVTFLTQHGANLNKQNKRGRTPLRYAVAHGHKEVAYYLFDKGARFNLERGEIESILRFVIAGGMERLIDYVLEGQEVDFHKKTSTGISYLHNAAEGGILGFAKRLLSEGLDIDEKNIYGWCPMHYAAYHGKNNMIDFLLTQGADISSLTNDGKSPFHLARENEQLETAQLLQDKGAYTGVPKFPYLSGKYIDSDLPEDTPKMFATGIVTLLQHFEHSMLTFSADFKACCWADFNRKILLMEKKDGRWQPPRSVLLNASNPCLSPDGQRIYYTAKRLLETGKRAGDTDIYYIERRNGGWSDPVNLGSGVNTELGEEQPSVTRDGTVYFRLEGDIYRSRLINGKYASREKLGDPINTESTESEPFIAHDGSFLLFRSLGTGGVEEDNFYISYRKPDDTWTRPVNFAKEIKRMMMFPSVTPDNKYLFYWSNGFYWIDTEIIKKLKLDESK